jgi:hypothetical protein
VVEIGVLTGGNDAHLAAAVYGLIVEGVALSFLAIMIWISRRGLLDSRWPVAALAKVVEPL